MRTASCGRAYASAEDSILISPKIGEKHTDQQEACKNRYWPIGSGGVSKERPKAAAVNPDILVAGTRACRL